MGGSVPQKKIMQRFTQTVRQNVNKFWAFSTNKMRSKTLRELERIDPLASSTSAQTPAKTSHPSPRLGCDAEVRGLRQATVLAGPSSQEHPRWGPAMRQLHERASE